MRYQPTKMYLHEKTEFEVACHSHRQPRTSVAELARLGAVAFTGATSDEWWRSVDHIAGFAARKAMGMVAQPPILSPIPAPDTLSAMQTYADKVAGLAVERDAKAGETRPAVDDDPPLRWRGIWQTGRKYRHADSTTHNGALWYAHHETDSRPGTDSSWQLMAKTFERAKAGR